MLAKRNISGTIVAKLEEEVCLHKVYLRATSSFLKYRLNLQNGK